MQISNFKATNLSNVKINTNTNISVPNISQIKSPTSIESFPIQLQTQEEYDINEEIKNIPETKIEYDKNGFKSNETTYKNGIKPKEIFYQNGIKSRINNYDSDGNLKSTYIYDSAGQLIIGEYLYTYDENNNLISSEVKNINTKIIIKTEYQNGEITTISKYQYNNNGVTTLINTIKVSELSELITNQGNLTIEDIQNMTCFDYSSSTELSTQITNLLTTDQIEAINEKIKDSVEYAGIGSGSAVAAAAITMITELQKNGIYLPYYYGGGHGTITEGVDTNWGTSSSWTGISEKRNINSMDCSGFLMWAMENGGIEISNNFTASSFLNLNNTEKISFQELTPGDVMADSGHVVLVLDTYQNENGETIAICAEATGDEKNGTTNGGVVITTFTESQSSSYSKINMDGYYAIH